MDVIRFSMTRPVTVTVGVLLVLLYGLAGLTYIPVQLTPTVDRPVITVRTAWTGRSPQEIVDEITRPQEEELKNVAGLSTLRSQSRQGESEITLEFDVGTDISRALQEVSDALRQVGDYPEDVAEPRVRAADGAAENAIAWMMLELKPEARQSHPGFDISTLLTRVDEEIRPLLERTPGVAEVNVFGGRRQQVQVMLDPIRLAQRGLSHAEVIAALRAENQDTSAGTFDEGKWELRVRVVGQFTGLSQIENTVIAYRGGLPVFVKDVGSARLGEEKATGFVRALGSPAIGMNVIRQSGANVVRVMEELRSRLDGVRQGILPGLHPTAGPDLRIRVVYDETVYIDSAVGLVTGNLWQAVGLVTLVLLMFLRSAWAVGILAVAIPVSVVSTFLVILAAGRTLNIISLAGLAFSTGMVVDNSIVVLENIARRRGLGDAPLEAIYRGTREVWGAVVASTLTTVCVFLPILTIREEAGQLFFDLSLAMAAAVAASLVVSLTVVPSYAALIFRGPRAGGAAGPQEMAGGGVVGVGVGRSRLRTLWEDLFGLVRLGDAAAGAVAGAVRWVITGWRLWAVAPALIVVMTLGSVVASRQLAPPLDYLPAGNRNLVFGGLLIPPGQSIEQRRQIARRIEDHVRPYIEASERGGGVEGLEPIPSGGGGGAAFDPVPVNHLFVGSFGGGIFIGAGSGDPGRVKPVGALVTDAMNRVPDAFGGARQASLFGRSVGGGNSVNIEVSGPDLERLTAAARGMMELAFEAFGRQNVRPDPTNFNLRQPEVRVALRDEGRRLGLRTEPVGTAVRSLFDGAFAGEYVLDGRAIDVVVRPEVEQLETRERLADVPIATPTGRVVPLGSVVEITEVLTPQEIVRIEELPAVTLRVSPPAGVTIQEVIETARSRVIGPARQSGLIDRTMRVRLEGSARQLDTVRADLFGDPERAAGLGGWLGALGPVGAGLLGVGVVVAAWCVVRGAARRRSGGLGEGLWGAAGAVGGALLLGVVVWGVGERPELLLARAVWVVVVTYLLMCALFESFVYPLVIMLSVPFAVVGGLLGLAAVHAWTMATPTIDPQQLDMLTMIGFVILVGTVVNNAILIVEQALNFMDPGKAGAAYAGEAGMEPAEAIALSVRSRMRPIFMTTLTTVVGGVPLVISPGAGSEMYRGLGAVVCAGMLCSTVFTLGLVPMMFAVTLRMRRGLVESLRPALRRGSALQRAAPLGAAEGLAAGSA
ncbi:MAG: hypothetical protein C0513_00690 [Isosphaera sp.]|nr:hypothetical protein [Isosphaera sp.]